MEIQDNPAFKLAYQLDEMTPVNYRVATGPVTNLSACFALVEHGYGNFPFIPLMLSMQ